ncbi:hypothetical protein BH18ACT5_BH18ACT5_19770 [soil metagenome]
MSETENKKRKVTLGVGIALLVLVVLIVALVVLFSGGGSFADLVAITRDAEEAEVWRTYFTAEDCLIEALTESPDALDNSIERLVTQTEALASHVDESLATFDSFGTRPWQGEIRDAPAAIVEHYVAWEDHLAKAGPLLGGIGSEPSSIAAGINAWIEQAQGAVDPISSTFEEAGTAFESAATSDADGKLLDSLFVPADVSCTQTAV